VEASEAALTQMVASVLPVLDERQRRTVAGSQARALGRGGIAVVARAAGTARSTVHKAAAEVDAGVGPAAPVPRAGQAARS
jgi:hypothetical protein